LVGVAHLNTVVFEVAQPVAIAVDGWAEVVVTGVPLSIVITVGLVGIADLWAVVF
jgi:hypothetical protein